MPKRSPGLIHLFPTKKAQAVRVPAVVLLVIILLIIGFAILLEIISWSRLLNILGTVLTTILLLLIVRWSARRESLVSLSLPVSTATISQYARPVMPSIAENNHEINGALTVILGFVELLEKELSEPFTAKQREYLDHISKAALAIRHKIHSSDLLLTTPVPTEGTNQ